MPYTMSDYASASQEAAILTGREKTTFLTSRDNLSLSHYMCVMIYRIYVLCCVLTIYCVLIPFREILEIRINKYSIKNHQPEYSENANKDISARFNSLLRITQHTHSSHST